MTNSSVSSLGQSNGGFMVHDSFDVSISEKNRLLVPWSRRLVVAAAGLKRRYYYYYYAALDIPTPSSNATTPPTNDERIVRVLSHLLASFDPPSILSYDHHPPPYQDHDYW
jgi:hypothetical protein